jgi:hypothetical protein
MFVADSIHIIKNKLEPHKWDVYVIYNFLGLIALKKKYFGIGLTKKQVQNLSVPLAKFCTYEDNTPFPNRTLT